MALTIEDMVAELREAMAEKLRVRGRSLEAQVRKAGRRLPKRVRRDATYLAQSVTLADNPKLARMIDLPRAARAHRNVLDHLDTVNIGAERRLAALGVLASIAFALLFTAILVLIVLVQRGFV